MTSHGNLSAELNYTNFAAMNIISSRIIPLLKNARYKQFLEVFWFAVITLAIHYSYRFWANSIHYWPIQAWMNEIHQVLTGWVFSQSVWINQQILNISLKISDHTMTFDNGSWISINGSCAGDKQILQFMLLILIYPGIWKQKLWFIPLGMLLIHFTNVLRIVLLSVVSINKPEWWHLAHDTVLRGMFYVVILILWIIWVERINRKPAR
jgi:exosortase/archaeosortase family protein